MQIYQCPNCGRTYTEFQNIYYCGSCNYRLVKQEYIKNIKHPELSEREYHVIGEIKDPTKPTVECPYCHGQDTKKISTTNKAVNTAIFGILGTKRHKQWHCNNCDSDF